VPTQSRIGVDPKIIPGLKRILRPATALGNITAGIIRSVGRRATATSNCQAAVGTSLVTHVGRLGGAKATDDGPEAHHEVASVSPETAQPEPQRFRGVALVAGADLAGHNNLVRTKINNWRG
jgi:hypothetical protein